MAATVLTLFVAARRWMRSYMQRRSFEQSVAQLPFSLYQRELEVSPLRPGTVDETSLNKIFACAWADDHELLAGTKDNQILRWRFNRDYSVRGKC